MKSEGHAEPALPFSGPGRAGPAYCWTLLSWPQPSQKSWPLHLGEMAPPLTTDGPTPYHRQRRTDTEWKDVGELALLPHLRQVVPVVRADQLSYHPDPQPSFGVAHPNMYPI